MSGWPGQIQGHGPHLLLYDGTCGFCNGMVRAVLDRDRRAVFHFASLQSPEAARQLARVGRRPGDVSTFVAIADYLDPSPQALTKASAALFVLTILGWRRTSALLRGIVPAVLLDRAYDLIARNRYRFVRRPEVCRVARPEERRRFIDAGREAAVSVPEVQP